MQADVASWTAPALTLLRGTALGARDFAFYRAAPESSRFVLRDVEEVPIPRDQWRSLPMEDQFDAVLYLGPRSTITTSELAPSLCTDELYMQMRLRRMSLSPLGQGLTEGLKDYCASGQ